MSQPGCRMACGAASIVIGALVLASCQTPAPTPTATSTSTPTATPTATSAPTTAPTASPTSQTDLQPGPTPEIIGDVRYRSVLRIDEPTWGPGRVDLTYQWMRGSTAIAGADGLEYRLQGADIGAMISVDIRGTKDGYAARTVRTTPVGPVTPGNLKTNTPRIRGAARVGNTLTGSVDPWGPGEVKLTLQWLRADMEIPKATGTTYKLVAADAGQVIKLRVTGSAKYYNQTSTTSDATGKVALGQLDPTPVPHYSGTAKVGRKITALPRTWGPGEVSLAYQWYREVKGKDVAISGATKVSYTPVGADAGHQLRVRVSGSKPGYETARVFSGYTSEIDPGDLTHEQPEISGEPVVGNTLTADPGKWGPGQVSLTYRWYRDDENSRPELMTRVQGNTYLIGAGDVGHTIFVVVHGEKAGYLDASATSDPTDVVQD